MPCCDPSVWCSLPGEMAGAGPRKGKKDDNGIGTAIDFVLSNARLVLGVGGAAMLGIATLAVKRVSWWYWEGSEKTWDVGTRWGETQKHRVLINWNCAWWCSFRCMTAQSVLPAAPPAWTSREREAGKSQTGWDPPHAYWARTWRLTSAAPCRPFPPSLQPQTQVQSSVAFPCCRIILACQSFKGTWKKRMLSLA